jgi:hypothetical protein
MSENANCLARCAQQHTHPQFFSALQDLVENVSASNGGRKVALLSVSYGPGYALAFLRRMPQAWKDKYVSLFVADSPIWGGAPSALYLYISGYIGVGNGTSLVTEIAKALAQESAVPWVFPRAVASSGPSEPLPPLVLTETKSYTALQYAELLTDLGATADEQALAEWLFRDPDLANFSSAGVDTLVACGVGLPTPSNATFATGLGTRGDWELTSIATANNGDGVSPSQSCLRLFSDDSSVNNSSHTTLRLSYPRMVHASCSYPDPANTTAPNSRCFADMMKIINGGNASVAA